MAQKDARKKSLSNVTNSILLAFILIGPIVWYGMRYNMVMKQLHLEWLVIIAVSLGGWCWYRHLRVVSMILLISGSLLIYYLFVSIPLWQNDLHKLSSDAPTVWVRGSIVQSTVIDKSVQLHLSNVNFYTEQKQQYFPEILLRFQIKRSTSKFYRNRYLQIAGILKESRLNTNRLTVFLDQVTYHDTPRSLSSWLYFGQVLKQRLINRAKFYLSSDAFSLYAPVILGLSQSRSNSTKVFRSSGMAHMLTISGLHIGLLYWLGFHLIKQVGRVSSRIPHWIYFPQVCQCVTIIGLWGYIFLIGFPIPALRAVMMLTIMVISRLSGQATSLLYILLTTAFLFICQNPSVIYDLSFQLSFVAVLYIFLVLPFSLKTSPLDNRRVNIQKGCINGLIITGGVLIGIWPIIVTHFNVIAFETFWLNLIMMPILAFVVLPLCFLAFITGLLLLDSLPYSFIEQSLFQFAEWGLEFWFSVLKFLHQWGQWSVFNISIEWEGWQYVAYYLSTFLIHQMLLKVKQRAHDSFKPFSV